MQYQLVAMKAFEKKEAFEDRLNSLAREGWRVITSMSSGAYLVLGKEK